MCRRIMWYCLKYVHGHLTIGYPRLGGPAEQLSSEILDLFQSFLQKLLSFLLPGSQATILLFQRLHFCSLRFAVITRFTLL